MIDYLHYIINDEIKLDENLIHDMKNPMAVIWAATQALRFDNNEDTLQSTFEIIDKNILLLSSLTDNMRDYNNIVSNNYKVNKEPTYIINYVESIMEKSNPLFNSKGLNIQLCTNISEDFAFFTDKYIIERVLTNLLSNAFKNTVRNTSIRVNLFKENGRIYLTVENVSPKIKKKRIYEIFNKGITVKSSENINGEGLGLYIVKKFSHLLNGDTLVVVNKNKIEVGIYLVYENIITKTTNFEEIEGEQLSFC